MTLFSNILKALQSITTAKFSVSNYFPKIGEAVTLTNQSSDDDSFTWTLNDGVTQTTNTVDDVVTITPAVDGDAPQQIQVQNTVNTDNYEEYLYTLPNLQQAHYDLSVDKQVVRVGESFTINLNNIYGFTDPHTLAINIYDEDGQVVQTIANASLSETVTLNTIGIYDIEVIATTNGYDITFREGMILTVTPALANRVDAFEHILEPVDEAYNFYGIPRSKIDGEDYNFTGATIAPGTTIVLKRDTQYPVDSVYRLEITRLKGTEQNPIIITIDESTPLLFGSESYYGIIIRECEHVIFDGRGYQNLERGIHIYRNPNLSQSNQNTLNRPLTICLQVSDFTTNFEAFGFEFYDCTFTAIMAKTDPRTNDPNTWRPTVEGGQGFNMMNCKFHNNYIHDVGGEGYYLGYFDGGTLVRTNDQGQEVSYRAHANIDWRVYRNRFERCGLDGLQFNGGYDSVIAHNVLIDSGIGGDFGQSTGMSLSLSGRINNNVINGVGSAGIQVGPTGPLDIYNNMIFGLKDGTRVLYLLGFQGTSPETNVGYPFAPTFKNQIPVNIYNNNLIATGKGQIQGAQNVVQYEGIVYRNNILSYIGNRFIGGLAEETNALILANSSDNVNLTDLTREETKIASVQNGNFNLAYDSPLGGGYPLFGSEFDLRGFKNFNIGTKFVGANNTIIDGTQFVLQVTSVVINSGATNTTSEILSVAISYSNDTPTRYRVSEDPTFTGVAYQTWTGQSGDSVSYTIDDPTTTATITVYVQIATDTYEANAVSDTIDYQAPYVAPFIQVDFGRDIYLTTSPWNNFATNIARSGTSGVVNMPGGETIANLLDNTGAFTGLSLEVTSAFDGYDANTVATNELYPTSASRDCWATPRDGSSTLQLQNCDATKVYDFTFFSSRGYVGSDTVFTIGLNTVSIAHKDEGGTNNGNVTTTASITGVSPDASNNIDIEIEGFNSSNLTGFINVLEITERIP